MSEKAPAPTPNMTIDTFMTTKIHAVTVEMTVNDAIGLLLTHKIGGAPVLDSMNKVISIITESDLMKIAPAHGLTKKVGQCLSSLVKPEDVVCAKKTSTFSEIYKLFLTKKVHRVVITDDSGRLQGLVTRSTVLRMLYGTAPAEEKKEEVKKAG